MRLSKSFVPTQKEIPADASIASHQLMLRAGLMRQLTAGVYAYLPLGYRAMLKAMNILWGNKIPLEGLMEMGARIGADVPCFVVGQGTFMGGKGERVLAILPQLKAWMVLINPGLPLSTKQVYEQGKWGLTKPGGDTKISMPPQDLEKMGKFLRNDLDGPAMELLPIISTLKERLREAGASGVSMTGSGPTVFGLCRTEAEARQAARDLKMEQGWICLVAKTLSEI